MILIPWSGATKRPHDRADSSYGAYITGTLGHCVISERRRNEAVSNVKFIIALLDTNNRLCCIDWNMLRQALYESEARDGQAPWSVPQSKYTAFKVRCAIKVPQKYTLVSSVSAQRKVLIGKCRDMKVVLSFCTVVLLSRCDLIQRTGWNE